MEYGLLSAEEWEERRIFEEWERKRREKKRECVKCISCGRKKLFLSEGRIINGDWRDDVYLSKYTGEWVCCYTCYQDLLRKVRERGGVE